MGPRPQPTGYPQLGAFCLSFTREGTAGLGSCTQYPNFLDTSPMMAERTQHTTSAGLRSTSVMGTLAVIVSTIF